jgi:hypothetical protein
VSCERLTARALHREAILSIYALTRVPDPVIVDISLIRVRCEDAVILNIRSVISIYVGVTQVAESIAIEISLFSVRDIGAIVFFIDDPILIIIIVTDITEPIPISVDERDPWLVFTATDRGLGICG